MYALEDSLSVIWPRPRCALILQGVVWSSSECENCPVDDVQINFPADVQDAPSPRQRATIRKAFRWRNDGGPTKKLKSTELTFS